jgi:dihydroorotase
MAPRARLRSGGRRVERLLIRGGRVLDPASGRDEVADLLIEDGLVAEIGAGLAGKDAEVVEASGCWVAPGLIDMHSHLREPGHQYKEDLASGGRAAVAGGFTSVACMANTAPVNDDPSVTHYILHRASVDSPARIYPIAAATKGLAGEVMTEMVALSEAGAVAFSDDGHTISDAGVMRVVLEYSKMVKLPVIVHAEDPALRGHGVINEGPVSTYLGLPGNPTLAEDILVARDLMLARLTGARLHIAHVTSAGAVKLISAARDEGVQVTAEVTPHHLTLTDEATAGYDTNFKMAPPLRSAEDMEACRQALVEGVIDVIATDHAPHALHEKEVEYTVAPPGILGLETAYAVVMDLVRENLLSPLALMQRMSTNVARILDIEGGSLEVGSRADVAVLNPELRWVYDPSKGYSKSRNSPWSGKELVGCAVATIVGGRIVYDRDRGVLVP